jgi:hypothetical protein
MHPVWSSAGSCSELSRKPLKRRKENIKVYFNMFYSHIMFHGLAMRKQSNMNTRRREKTGAEKHHDGHPN